jgi:hypothetical protein
VAVERAHELFRWFGGGWGVNADLPTPAGFEAASQFVRPDDVASSIACGPDLDELVASVEPYWQAGFTDIALVQVGDETQQRFRRDRSRASHQTPGRGARSLTSPGRPLTTTDNSPDGQLSRQTRDIS